MNLNTETRRGYDIATGLCGCGIPQLNNLKWLITGRLRHLAGVNPSGCCLVRTEEFTRHHLPRVCQELERLEAEVEHQRLLKVVTIHWLNHAHQAALRLGNGQRLARFTLALLLAVRFSDEGAWEKVYGILEEGLE